MFDWVLEVPILSIVCYLPLAGGTLTGTLNGRHIIPTANNTYDLGSASALWNQVFATQLEVGHASDTSVSRKAAGLLGVEGRAVVTHNNTGYSSAEIFVLTSAPTTQGANGDIAYVV